jgi:hypothetical protein
MVEMIEETKIIFEEIQKPRQLWLQTVIIIYSLFLTYIMVNQVVFNVPFNAIPMPNRRLSCYGGFGVVYQFLYYTASLSNSVFREDGLYNQSTFLFTFLL